MFHFRVQFGDEHFDVVHLMASEVAKIKAWTGHPSKQAWIKALLEGDIEAFQAAYVLMKQRDGVEVRIANADFDTDDLKLTLVHTPTGREIEDDPEASPGSSGVRFVDDGAPVPPPEAA